MPPYHAANTSAPSSGNRPDWPRLVERASEALLRKLAVRAELTPRQVAQTVAAALPLDVASWLIERLRTLGWLDPAARIPFDVLNSPACPPDLSDGRRELLRLATFGVPAEGRPSDAKRREAIYQQRCAEIMRETRDLESLSYAAARALGHPEVHADPVLFSMLRSFIAEREAEIRSRAHLPDLGEEEDAQAAPGAHQATEYKIPLRERVQTAMGRLQLELERQLANYNDAGAEQVLVQIRDLRHRYPGHVEVAVVEGCERQVESLAEKRDLFRKQLNELVQQATAAIGQGDQKAAAWVLRRLSAIHTLLPAVLPEDRLKTLREAIHHYGEKHERHEVARQLVTRERAVGAKIKRLGAIIHRYHKLAPESTIDDPAARRAEQAYRRAVDEVRTCDDEWLADLMIELDGLLEDLHGPRDRAESQVDQFVNNVRLALHQMRQEIRAIEKERASSLDNN